MANEHEPQEGQPFEDAASIISKEFEMHLRIRTANLLYSAAAESLQGDLEIAAKLGNQGMKGLSNAKRIGPEFKPELKALFERFGGGDVGAEFVAKMGIKLAEQAGLQIEGAQPTILQLDQPGVDRLLPQTPVTRQEENESPQAEQKPTPAPPAAEPERSGESKDEIVLSLEFVDNQKSIKRGNDVIHFSEAEWEILAYVRDRGTAGVSSSDLFAHQRFAGKSRGYPTVMIGALRGKLEFNPKDPQYLKNIREGQFVRYVLNLHQSPQGGTQQVMTNEASSDADQQGLQIEDIEAFNHDTQDKPKAEVEVETFRSTSIYSSAQSEMRSSIFTEAEIEQLSNEPFTTEELHIATTVILSEAVQEFFENSGQPLSQNDIWYVKGVAQKMLKSVPETLGDIRTEESFKQKLLAFLRNPDQGFTVNMMGEHSEEAAYLLTILAQIPSEAEALALLHRD